MLAIFAVLFHAVAVGQKTLPLVAHRALHPGLFDVGIATDAAWNPKEGKAGIWKTKPSVILLALASNSNGIR